MTKVAQALGISRNALYTKIKKYEIEKLKDYEVISLLRLSRKIYYSIKKEMSEKK